MTRLVVSPDTLDFYYGYATVDAVDARGGGYDVGATLYQLEGAVEVDVPEPATYRIVPTDDGVRFETGLRRVARRSSSCPTAPCRATTARSGQGNRRTRVETLAKRVHRDQRLRDHRVVRGERGGRPAVPRAPRASRSSSP